MNEKILCFILGIMAIVTTSTNANASWQRILTCDGGVAVVDKSLESPRYAQIVIKDPRIVSYLTSTGQIYANDKGEVILAGQNSADINNPQDFQGFQVFSEMGSNNWAARRGYGLQISYNKRTLPSNSDCGHDIPASDPYCQGQINEIANWYFQHCE